MVSIRIYNEGQCWDVIIQRSGDEIISFEFNTKKDAVAFASRAYDFFSDVTDVQLIKPYSTSVGSSDSEGKELAGSTPA